MSGKTTADMIRKIFLLKYGKIYRSYRSRHLNTIQSNRWNRIILRHNDSAPVYSQCNCNLQRKVHFPKLSFSRVNNTVNMTSFSSKYPQKTRTVLHLFLSFTLIQNWYIGCIFGFYCSTRHLKKRKKKEILNWRSERSTCTCE